MTDTNSNVREPSLFDALLPLLALVCLLGLSVYLYGENSSYGANQIALLCCGGIAALIGLKNGQRWESFQQAIVHGISMATTAMLILLSVGALIGTWILAGTVPVLIDYGLQLMNPSWFYPATCIICAVVGLAIGSSWTVAGTLGVALMAVAQGLGLSPEITAGAVISGAYFGDKMSPLSDTTNLAPATAGSELFAHVRHMTWTTVPSLVIALIGFTLIGFGSEAHGAVQLDSFLGTLRGQFNFGPHLLIPLVLVLVLAMRKFPALPTIFIGALVGAVFAVIFQPDSVVRIANNPELSRPLALISGAWSALFDGYKLESGDAAIDKLLQRGGMSSMLNTIWLILCAMAFGACMERAGMLDRLVRGAVKLARSTASLIITTLATCIGMNVITADQYIAIVLPGRIFRAEYERRGLAPVNLSRALEDAGTLTSPLVPWNTCGAYMAATLGVATTGYLPYALFNLANPIIAAILAMLGVGILRAAQPAKAEPRAA